MKLYNISAEAEQAFKGNGRTTWVNIIISGRTIGSEEIKSLNISQSICTSDFEIGTVNAARFEAEISNINGKYTDFDFENLDTAVTIFIQLANGGTESVPLGVFTISDSYEDNRVIKITGYDNIIKTEKQYVPSDIYPATLRAVAADVAAVCELELAEDKFCNDDLIIDHMPEWNGIDCRKVLGYIAEAAGSCCVADRNGKIKFVSYGLSESCGNITPDMYYSVKLSKRHFIGIKSFYIISGDKELFWSVNGNEEYSIINNPLLSDKETAQAASVGLKGIFDNVSYLPFDMDYIGNPAIDVGDWTYIRNVDGEEYHSVICARTLTWDGGLRGTLAAYADEEAKGRGSLGGSYGEQIKTAQKTSDEAKTAADNAQKTADEVKSTVDNLPEIAVNVVNTNVIKSDTMQATWCFSRYMLVQFMETNFDALDTAKAYKRLRKYIRIFDDNIKIIEAELSETETEDYKDPNGQKLYWTAVTGTNAHKFFTYTSPLTIAASERPEGLTDAEFEALYTVKVRKTIVEDGKKKEYVKGSLGFPLNSEGTGEPELVFGTGDERGNGRYYFVKDADSGRFVYTSRIDGKEYGIAIKDDAPYLVTAGQLTRMYPIAVRADISDVSDLPVGTIIMQGQVN